MSLTLQLIYCNVKGGRVAAACSSGPAARIVGKAAGTSRGVSRRGVNGCLLRSGELALDVEGQDACGLGHARPMPTVLLATARRRSAARVAEAATQPPWQPIGDCAAALNIDDHAAPVNAAAVPSAVCKLQGVFADKLDKPVAS